MAEEVTHINEVKSTSDGRVDISVEKYNELLRLANKPQTINRTQVVKTAEIAAKEYRVWGVGLMGLGGAIFTIGAVVYRAGRI